MAKTDFMKRFELLCMDHGLSIRGACEEIGISVSASTNWKKGRFPNAKTQAMIADYFNISVDELMRPADSVKGAVISDDKIELVSNYTKLNEEDKKLIRRMIRALLKDKSGDEE